ncbi:MAG TPA: DUF2142 domain-containing protein, partial [Anaerolineales bacterium]
RGYHYGPLHSRSNYSPVLLFPQAMVMRYLGRRAELPALWVYYATRLAGLLTYTLLAWLAVRWLPFGKWILMVLAAAPIAVYQSATISADSISNGIGLLFISGCLAIQARERLGWKEWGELVLLTALLFTAKPNLFPLAVLPFLLIPPSRFTKRSLYLLWMAAAVVLFAVIVLGWNAISPNAGLAASGEVNASEQLRYILSHPLVFIRTILGDLWAQWPRHLRQWVGVYGYGYGNVPILTYVLFAIGLGLALLVRTEAQAPERRVRIILVVFFAAAYLFTMVALYLTFTAVAEEFVYGVQGRYLIPIFPLLFLALYDLPALRRFKAGKPLVLTFAIGALAVYIFGLVLSYHVNCGTTIYNRGLCFQPVYKNFLPLTHSSPPLSAGTSLVQEFTPTCNGLTAMQVRVNSPGTDPNGGMLIRLHDEQQNSDLFEKTVKVNELLEDAWYAVSFDPIWDSAGKAYNLSITGMNAPAGEGPRLAYSIRPEYPAGVLYENGKALEDDVLFQYGCLTGLDQWLKTHTQVKP